MRFRSLPSVLAGLSVLAHLESLVQAGLVETDGDPAIDGVFRPL